MALSRLLLCAVYFSILDDELLYAATAFSIFCCVAASESPYKLSYCLYGFDADVPTAIPSLYNAVAPPVFAPVSVKSLSAPVSFALI